MQCGQATCCLTPDVCAGSIDQFGAHMNQLQLFMAVPPFVNVSHLDNVE